jgi:hypothetical protein
MSLPAIFATPHVARMGYAKELTVHYHPSLAFASSLLNAMVFAN